MRRERLAWQAVSARRDVGWIRHELLGLLRARRARRALPLRRRRRRAAPRADTAHRVQLARLPPRRRAGPALRLPHARAVRARARPSLQPRPSSCSIPMPRRSTAPCAGTSPTSTRTCRARPARTMSRTSPTTRPRCRAASSSIRASTGRATGGSRRPGTRRSSTSCTCAASRSGTRACARISAARMRAWRPTRRSRT